MPPRRRRVQLVPTAQINPSRPKTRVQPFNPRLALPAMPSSSTPPWFVSSPLILDATAISSLSTCLSLSLSMPVVKK
ncbi:hypothetical protein M0R45_016772 [Rubus argutus]|uniref:Uncharacterized protein n=1 Tax=Rubus argutus TaxID=59490 RepID=A0AAW1XX50_RUBAR